MPRINFDLKDILINLSISFINIVFNIKNLQKGKPLSSIGITVL